MPWRCGAWWPQEVTNTSPPAYTQAPHKNYTRVTARGTGGGLGKLTGFTVEGGRAAGEIEYRGMTLRLTIEGWDFSIASSFVGQPFAVRWDTGSDADSIADDLVRWPKGPPCIFAGYVVSYNTRHLVGADGQAHTITEVVADDWLGEWAYLRPWSTAISQTQLQPAAAGWVFRTPEIRHRCEGVRLGSLADEASLNVGLEVSSDDLADWSTLTAGDAIRAVEAATATEIFIRHGERLGHIDPGDSTVSVPPAELPGTGGGSRTWQWYTRAPQMVVRKVGGPHHWTTFDAPHVIVTEDINSELTSSSMTVNGAPIPNRFRPGSRPYEIEVIYPPPLDRVTLTGIGGAPEGQAVHTSHGLSWERSIMERPDLPVGSGTAFQDQITANANVYLDANTNFYKIYKVTIRNLTDEEITAWAGIGFADEVVLDPPDSTVLPNIAEVRWLRWESSAITGTNLILELTPVENPIPDPLDPAPPVIPPAPVALWTADITWRGIREGHSGYDLGPPQHGAISDDDLEIAGTTVRFRAIIRRRSGRMRVVVETAAQMDLIEGKWMQLELAAGTRVFQIPASDFGTTTTTGIVIADADQPASGTTVPVALWDEDPT